MSDKLRQGVIRLSAQVLHEILLLPESYTVEMAYTPECSTDICLLVSNPDLPVKGINTHLPEVKPIYGVNDGKPELLRIEVNVGLPYPGAILSPEERRQLL